MTQSRKVISNQYAALIMAVRAGQLMEVERLIHTGLDVNGHPNKRFWETPLHAAIQAGNIQMAKLLLFEKANVNLLDRCNHSPLYIAAAYGQLEIAELLLEKGAIIDNSMDGWTPLHVASSPPLMDLLLLKGADINAKNNQGYTPFQMTLFGEGIEKARYLSAKGANVDIPDNQGETALHDAIRRSNNQGETASLGENPDDPTLDIKRLQGETYFRLRVGQWRIIYDRDDKVKIIAIEKIKPRGGAYK